MTLPTVFLYMDCEMVCSCSLYEYSNRFFSWWHVYTKTAGYDIVMFILRASEAVKQSIVLSRLFLCPCVRIITESYWSEINATWQQYALRCPWKWLDFGDIWPWLLTLRQNYLQRENYRSDYKCNFMWQWILLVLYKWNNSGLIWPWLLTLRHAL